MKFEITQKGANGADGKRIPIGTVLDIEGDTVPGYLVGKGCKVTGKTAVTNPAKGAVQQPVPDPAPSGQERQALMKAAALQMESDDFLADGRPDVRALNDELTDEATPFSADERDQLWPGIADAVKAERAAD